MLTAGDKVIFKAEQDWIAEKYNFSMEKEYEVMSTNHFWCSAKIINDLGKAMSFDVSRLIKVDNHLDEIDVKQSEQSNEGARK